MLQGASGASLSLLDGSDLVIKVGEGAIGERIGVQAEWLERHASPALPKVIHRWDHGMVMERLDPVQWAVVDHAQLVADIFVALRLHVWSHDTESQFDLAMHEQFVWERCANLKYSAGSWPAMQAWMKEVPWEVLEDTTCLTHGDPTFDNVCYRNHRQVVLVDPNPAWPGIPSCRIADLAHVAQSLHGYEHLKYGRPMPKCGPKILCEFVNDDEYELLKYLTTVKFIRLLAYETEMRQVFADVADTMIRTRGEPT